MKIFLSYRRADTQATAGRMAQFLDAIASVEKVFLDVDDIDLGEDFQRRIERTLAEASHVFLLIGAQWSGPAGASGRARIFDADDVVRRETGTALRSAKVRLVPILVDEARMPRPDELPDDLQQLPRINAFCLRSAHFDEDMDDLLDVLLGGRKGRGSRWRVAPLTPAGIALRALAGLAAGAALLVAAGVANRTLGDCYDLTCTLKKNLHLASDGDALGLLWMIAIAVLAAAALAPFVLRKLRNRR